MTAFADYIVPVGLRLMGITTYSDKLEKAINSYELIPRDSAWKVEIRAHCIYATALLCQEINKKRTPENKIIIPQVDARFAALPHHPPPWPHHLTRTVNAAGVRCPRLTSRCGREPGAPNTRANT